MLSIILCISHAVLRQTCQCLTNTCVFRGGCYIFVYIKKLYIYTCICMVQPPNPALIPPPHNLYKINKRPGVRRGCAGYRKFLLASWALIHLACRKREGSKSAAGETKNREQLSNRQKNKNPLQTKSPSLRNSFRALAPSNGCRKRRFQKAPPGVSMTL